jgi:hypothetical protein
MIKTLYLWRDEDRGIEVEWELNYPTAFIFKIHDKSLIGTMGILMWPDPPIRQWEQYVEQIIDSVLAGYGFVVPANG